MSKTRSDSKLQPHEDFVFERLIDGNQSYQTVADAIENELGISTSVAALSTYFSKHAWRWRAERAAAQASAIEAALECADFGQAKAKAIAQREFELAAGNLSIDDLVKLRGLQLREKDLDNRSATLDLKLRQYEDQINAAKADLSKAKASGGMTVEAIEQMEQRLGLL